jgi:dienelactone hydrolase
MTMLNRWTESSFTANDRTYPTYRRGSGPGVVVMAEIPGMTPSVIAFADRVVAAGMTVVMPSLFGVPGKEPNGLATAKVLAQICVSKEFTALALNKTPPVTVWLRALAADLHGELGGPGVGAVGMCITGGFALAMMVEPHTVAPVLSQPSSPLFVRGKAAAADVNLSPADLAVVKARAAAGCEVLGLRYTGDKLVGTRFDTLRRELGDAFLAVELESRKPSDHSVLTEQADQASIERVISFLRAKLHPDALT